MRMYCIFDHIYVASFIVQQRIYGRFAREIWGSRVLRVTMAILTIFMMELFNRYINKLFIVVICPIVICFGPLMHYYTKNRNNDLELMVASFRKLPSSLQSIFVGYVMLLFIIIPIFIILLAILSIGGYL
ncbi:hypothetical protein BC624_101426 [Flavobacterium granuli]|uniref:Uncharacterized protein n=1 Tax=Flavobacterium granuli TaxID=280093 RepID=A0A1M5IWB4_9FLAO|nr:hypothetical protein BC624_101426 [Flavobacterium granuli]SHG32612.1 hypothetical protein SAMN05443373_101426 [Flavobacterium granuli]